MNQQTITLSQRELDRITVMEKIISKQITQETAGDMLNLSTRQIRRILAAYKAHRAAGLIHKGRGRKAHNRIPQEIIDNATTILKDEKYKGFKPRYANEKLKELHNIHISTERLRLAMIDEGLWEPKKRKRIKHHPQRSRRPREGELIQLDGSPHDWFEGRASRCDLLVFIDDATSKIMHAEFVHKESTDSYFIACKRYIERYGKPKSLYTDKHSVFRVNSTRNGSAALSDEVGETQFGRAMRELGIELIFANTPQAKGRVERANQTLQDRLVKEMRLHNISSIEEGNEFLLNTYLPMHNKRFAVQADDPTDAHTPLLPSEDLDKILVHKFTRKVSKNLSIQFQHLILQLNVKRGREYFWRKKTVEVIQELDGTIRVERKGRPVPFTVYRGKTRSRIVSSKGVNHFVDRLLKKKK